MGFDATVKRILFLPDQRCCSSGRKKQLCNGLQRVEYRCDR